MNMQCYILLFPLNSVYTITTFYKHHFKRLYNKPLWECTIICTNIPHLLGIQALSKCFIIVNCTKGNFSKQSFYHLLAYFSWKNLQHKNIGTSLHLTHHFIRKFSVLTLIIKLSIVKWKYEHHYETFNYFILLNEHPSFLPVSHQSYSSFFGRMANSNTLPGTFLVFQWLRICLPMQGIWVQSPVRELRFPPAVVQLSPDAAK